MKTVEDIMRGTQPNRITFIDECANVSVLAFCTKLIISSTHPVLVLDMPGKDYKNVSVPVAIYSALEEIADNKGSLYGSVSELVKEALREKIITVRSQNREWK